MSQAFAEFLLDNANSGAELLQVLDHIEDCYNEDVATALWYNGWSYQNHYLALVPC